ncbi:MAG: hypothetical protein ACR2GY_12740 [Phycisphaerales bacterium]
MKSLHSRFCCVAASALGLLLCVQPAAADIFTYQGELRQGGEAVNDNCDFRFTLWDAAVGGVQIGAQVNVNNVALVDGRVTADLDFGAAAFNGANRWIQVAVRCPAGSGGYTTLTPRQAVRPTPYALKSLGNTMSWMDFAGEVRTSDLVGIGVADANQVLHIGGNSSRPPTFAISNTNAPANLRTIGIRGATNGALDFGRMDDSGTNMTRTDMTLNSGGSLLLGTTSSGGGARLSIQSVGSNQGVTKGMYVLHTDPFHQQTIAGHFASDSSNGTALLAQSLATSGPTRALSAVSNSSQGWAGYFTGRGYFSDFLGVGRQTTISSAEIFGISVAANGYGGMYANVDGASRTAKPFYGYATNGVSQAWTYYDDATNQWRVHAGGTRIAVDKDTGFVGVGTAVPAVRFNVDGGSDTSLGGGGYIVTGAVTGGNMSIDTNEIQARNNGGAAILYLNHEGGSVHIGQGSGGTNRLVVPVVQITGGSDFSEMFDVNGETEVQPGMVVVLDPDNPGQLLPSTDAYDRKVAGIVSGGGGVATGMTMGHEGTVADGSHPVALSGRVYCLVDATDCAIEVGDMLTTSSTPGHAMKADDLTLAQGAIIGKAMSTLKKGETGLVLVLVNLQ